MRGPAPTARSGAPHRRHRPHRLQRDARGHLARARGAVAEDDRHLGDPESGQQRAVGDLDLEHVALGADGVELDRLEHLAADALEAAGEVMDGDAEDHARVDAAAAADQRGAAGPSRARRRPARSASRARGRRPGGGQQLGQVARVVGEVGVHLDQQLGSLRERVAKAGAVGAAQPGFARPVQDLQSLESLRPGGRRSGRCRRASCHRRRGCGSRPAGPVELGGGGAARCRSRLAASL